MRLLHTARQAGATIAILAALSTSAPAQNKPPDTLKLPENATALEGLPQVRVDVTRDATSRRTLGPAEATAAPLAIRIAGGRFYWASQGDRPLAPSASGAFTYLSSAEPGRYVRIQRLKDRFTYVEHLDTDTGSVTFWGELRVVLSR